MTTTYPVIPGRAKGASPESITSCTGVMDSGQPLRGFRNDAKEFCLIANKHTPEFGPGVWMWTR